MVLQQAKLKSIPKVYFPLKLFISQPEIGEALKSNLLTTKIRLPALPAKRVQRSRLLQKLNEGLGSNRRITLVSAPAGFGKTTCIAEWVNALDCWTASWLSLDSADDDPARFFTYLVKALQRVNQNFGLELDGTLLAGQLPSAEILATSLVNELLELESQFLLILDDFHVIQDRFILQVFEYLLANLPRSLHLVLITREDPPLPLAQLRAKNQLTEIRAGDLRFNGHDAEQFYTEVMGLSLTQTDINLLAEKTEGWIAGLQLAGLSIREREDPSGFIASLSGRHRYILGYLTEQVLDRQPKEIRHFLLQTSILDKLNGDLCNSITRRKDGQAFLEQVYKANLFLIPLDDDGHWYRYHHLFADLLRNLQNEFQEEEVAKLHQRASRWFAREGMASEAIEHALAARDFPQAVDLLEKHASGLVMQGFAKTVHGWVQALPEKWEARRPRTNLAFAWANLLRGAYPEATEYLEMAGSALPNDPQRTEDKSILAEWLVIRSLKAYMQGCEMECADLATRGLALAPKRDNRVRSLAFYVMASVYQLREEYARASEAYRTSIQLGRAAENLIAEMLSTVGLAGMMLERGQLHLAFEIASQAIDRIERSGPPPPISAVAYASLGDVYYQWNQVKEARRHFLRAMQLSILGGSNTVTIFCHVLLSRLSRIEGDLVSAAEEIQRAAELIPLEAPEYIRQEVASQLVQIHLARNRPAAARMALQGHGFSFEGRFSYPDLIPDRSISYASGLLYNSSLRIILRQARSRNDPTNLKIALDLADRVIAGASKGEQHLVILEALLLRAQLHAALDDGPSSQADYLQALSLGEPEGFIGIFFEGGPSVGAALEDLFKRGHLGNIQPDYVERILSVFPKAHPTGIPQTAPGRPAINEPHPLVEPLTKRELEVLNLMAEGMKYKEIADRLFISQNTVRFHVKAIYSKFNVNNRTQAIEMARQYRVL
jgi:LuxR family maltose regulon positive regulatory protein